MDPDIKTHIFMKIVDNDNRIFASLDQHQFVQPQTPQSDSQTATSGKMLVLLTRGLVVLDNLRLSLLQGKNRPNKSLSIKGLQTWVATKSMKVSQEMIGEQMWAVKQRRGRRKGVKWEIIPILHEHNHSEKNAAWKAHLPMMVSMVRYLHDLGFMIVLLILCNLPSAHSLHTKASEWTTCLWICKRSKKFNKLK